MSTTTSRRPAARVYPRPSGTFRVQWRHDGRTHYSPSMSRGDAFTLADHITDLGCRITGNDPRITSGSLIAGGPEAPVLAPVAPKLDTTLGHWVDRWIEEIGSERSRASYYRAAARLAPYRGADLTGWTEDHSRRVQRALLRDVAPGTVKGIMERLYAALVMAHRYGVVTVLPKRVKLKTSRRGVALTPAQVDALLAALPNDDSRELAELMVETGLRIGEALGLQAGDLDPVARAIVVRRNLAIRADQTGDTKTEKSSSPVLCTPATWALVTRRARGRANDEPLFARVGSKGAYGVATATYQGWFRETAAELAVEGVLPAGVRPHDLRHTHGSWLVAAGWSFTAVADRLRNTPEEVARTYAHTPSTADRGMVADIAAIRAGSRDELAERRTG